MAVGGFKYLGINITPDLQEFCALNLLSPLDRLMRDVHHWSTLLLLLLGRSVLYKIMSLPRFVYALQNDPFLVPDSYFATIDGEVRKLIWEGAAPGLLYVN